MTSTPYTDILEVDPNQLGKAVAVNEALNAIDRMLGEIRTIDLTGLSSPLDIEFDDTGDEPIAAKTAIRFQYLRLTGNATDPDFTVRMPEGKRRMFAARNLTTPSSDIMISVSGGPGVVLPAGSTQIVFSSGAGVFAMAPPSFATDPVTGAPWTVGNGLQLDTTTDPDTLEVADDLELVGSLTVAGNANPTLNIIDGGNYTALYPTDGTGNARGIFLGSLTGGSGANLHRNATHIFQPAGGGATWAEINTYGVTVTGQMTINAGAGNFLSATSDNGVDCAAYWTVTGTRTWVQAIKSNGDYWLYDVTAVAGRIAITTAGSCQASSTWSVISDMALKTNVQPYTRGLADIVQLDPIMFEWTGKAGTPDDGKLHYGLSAQQVAEVMPELAREHRHIPPEGSDEEPMTLAAYSPTDITFALIGAVKELASQVQDLQAQIAELRSA